jgi:hypothetical protein
MRVELIGPYGYINHNPAVGWKDYVLVNEIRAQVIVLLQYHCKRLSSAIPVTFHHKYN